jgi:hypothetical protein
MLAVGCGDAERTCDELRGRYTASYSALTGTCGAIEDPPGVPVVSQMGLVARVEMLGDLEVETDLEAKGCNASLRQGSRIRSQDGTLHATSLVSSSDLAIVSDTELYGEVTFERFTQDGRSQCMGTYTVTLSKDPSPVAGASASAAN